MIAPHLARLVGAAALAAFSFAVAPAVVPTASAEPCPDIEVVSARGTFAPQGLDETGQTFVDALQEKVGGRSVGSYSVVYPASINFPRAVDGIRDAANHIQSMVATCPKTKLVLSGYSQGAAVIGFVTNNAVPGGVDPADVPPPMPASVARHVAAVVLFGKPSPAFMGKIDQPPVNIGPLYGNKVDELCAVGDPICSDGDDRSAHSSYVRSGLVDQGAAFAASKV